MPENSYRIELEAIRAETLRLRGITEPARSRALDRLVQAQTLPAPAPADMWATRMMREQAGIAEAKIAVEIHTVASATGLSAEFVRSEYRRLMAEAPANARLLELLPYPMPNDPGTRHAIHTLRRLQRCATCGQFLSTEPHNCPAGESAADSSGGQMNVAAQRSGESFRPVTEMNMDEFQELYDEAQERIRSGNRRVPSLPDLEQVAGGVTGGLSSENGTTFGLEIEIDFPNDYYPYSARQELAQRLAEEGLAMSPEVMRWHYLGGADEGRPGGEYQQSSADWVCEFDRTVDDVDGERGVEIKSQILTDVPETWRNLRRICEIAEELGGRPTQRTGVHVNIGAQDFPSDDPSVHLRLLRLMESMDDTLIRLAHNPECGPRHRGRNYCAPVSTPAHDLTDVADVKRFAGHYHAVNLGHLPDEYSERSDSSRIEMRIFDSSLDVGRLQSQVTLSLALAKAAVVGDDIGLGPQQAGHARETFGPRRLSGEEWEQATLPFRRLLSLVSKHGAGGPGHTKQLVHLFAESRWPHRW